MASRPSGTTVVKKIHLTETLDTRGIYGRLDENLRLIEGNFGVHISARGHQIFIDGASEDVDKVEGLFRSLDDLGVQGRPITPDEVRSAIRHYSGNDFVAKPYQEVVNDGIVLRRKRITPKTPAQERYIETLRTHDLVFGVGPAGTGKTYLAVAMAIQALQEERCRRIVLTRPAVEAGERLGFLPGDISEKIDPYLRPLYDALYDMMGFEMVERALDRHQIEIAPLAFMRGRTLNESFIILDEAQNTTSEQMMMFLTRLGNHSRAVVTGDVTQVDLPPDRISGLSEAISVLNGVSGIGFLHFTRQDVVRHVLVQRIIEAYEHHGQRKQRPGGG